MSAIRTRSSSVPRPGSEQLPRGIIATRSAGKKRNNSPAPPPLPLVFLANIGQDIIPLAPVLPATELPIPVEEVLAAQAQADLPEEDPAEIPGEIQDDKEADPDREVYLNLYRDLSIPSNAGKPSRMFSQADVRNLIREAMSEYHEVMTNSVQALPKETAQHITGSQAPSTVMDDDQDIPSIIEIDLANVIDPAAIETRRVSVKEYSITTTHQSSQATKINFTNDGTNNRMKLKELELLLNDCELFTLAEEKRVPVKSTELNPDGYTHESAKFDGSKIIITKKDDYFKFNADCIRLFAIMNQATNKDMHYLLTQSLKDKNGVEWYKVIKTFALGERSNESGLSRKLLDELKLPSSKTVKENIAAFEEAVLRVDNVNLTSMTDVEKLFIIHKKLQDNKQDGMQAILYLARATEKTYRELLDQLMKADPPIIKPHKMNSISEEACRNFAKGTCTFGENCKYSHKTSKPEKGGGGKKGYDKPKTGTTRQNKYEPPQTKKVGFEHRAKVAGEPRGKPTEKNPEGFSIKQRVVLKSLMTSETDNWQNPAYFETSKSQNRSEHLNMFKTSSIKAHVQPRRTSPRQKVVPAEIANALADQEELLEAIDDRVKKFRKLHIFIPTIKDLLLYVHKHQKTDLVTSHDESEAIIFTGFRWQSSCNPLMNMCKQNFQVKEADPRVMQLLYENGEFFKARIRFPEAEELTYRDFNLFQPSVNNYFEMGTPGSYMSRIETVEEFYILGLQIYSIHNMSDTRNVLMLGLVYDFMSFAAEHLYVSVVTRTTIMAGRVILREAIKEMNNDPKYVELIMLTKLFHAIVDSVRPPYITPTTPPSPVARSFSVMSAPSNAQPQRYEDLSGIDTDDEMNLESAVAIFGEQDEWSDTDADSISPTEILQEKDLQRSNATPPIKYKRDRHIRNAANFPDTPELFTPQPKKMKRTEAKVVRGKIGYDSDAQDPDSFPVHPPRSPAPAVAQDHPQRSTSSTPSAQRTPATPQSTPRRVVIGRYGNGAPRWGMRVKTTKPAADVPQTSSSSSSSSSSQVAMTSASTYVDSGSAARPTPQETSIRSISGSSKSHGVQSAAAASSKSTTSSPMSQTPHSGSAAHPSDSPQYWTDVDVDDASSVPSHAHSGSATSAHSDSASAALPEGKSGSAASTQSPGRLPRRFVKPPNAYVVDLTSPAQARRVLRNFGRVPRPNSTSCML